MTRTAGRRPGLTLIELLVVIAIVILIAAIAALGVQSSYFQSHKVISGADRVGGWLVIAKQRAKRDGHPIGLRFFRDPNNPTQVKEAQYIEQPDPIVLNPDQERNPNGPRILLSYKQFPTTATPPYPAVQTRTVFLYVSDPTPATNTAYLNDFGNQVFVGDLLVLPEFGGAYRITNIQMPPVSPNEVHIGSVPSPAGILNAANARMLTLVSQPDMGAGHSVAPTAPLPTETTLVTYKYAFQSSPKPLAGEPILQITGGTCIDYREQGVVTPEPQTTYGVQMTVGNYFDILFAPDGHVLNNNLGLICLWVRDPSMISHPRLHPTSGTPDDAAGYTEAGQQMLVTVYTQTGLIANHPISDKFPPTVLFYDPWAYAKDGINSGF